MKIGIVCYPTFGGSGVVATELGMALADKGHEVHFITYNQPVRLDFISHHLHLGNDHEDHCHGIFHESSFIFERLLEHCK